MVVIFTPSFHLKISIFSKDFINGVINEAVSNHGTLHKRCGSSILGVYYSISRSVHCYC